MSRVGVSYRWPVSMKLANGAVVVLSTIAQAQDELLAVEAHLLIGARPMRRRELLAGRTMARHAMSLLGVNSAAILADSYGAPCWPVGLCGSIAHSPQHIAVVVSKNQPLRSLGIDIEDGRDLGRAAADVASVSDIEAVLALEQPHDANAAVRLAFSAKEAVFKCQAPVTGNLDLDFDEVALSGRPDGALAAKYVGPGAAPGMAALENIAIYFQEIQGVTVIVAAMEYDPSYFV